MAYFILVPVYLALLMLAFIAAVGAWLVPTLRHLAAYIVASTLLSIPLVILANALLWLILLVPLLGLMAITGPARPQPGDPVTVVASIYAIMLFIASMIAPMIVTPVAIILAPVLACPYIYKRRAARAKAGR